MKTRNHAMQPHTRPLIHTLLAGLLLGLSALHPAGAAESVPPLINYQGSLTDANGAPMAGVKEMAFNLYDAPTGGNLIWGPQIYATVPLINGKFNVLLGPTDGGGKLITTAFADKTRYLSITIEGKEITPRQQILSTPFAMQAANGSPPGSITAYMSNAIPDGWLLCNGATIPQEPKYDKLRSLIGNNVPDMRGMFLRGAGQHANRILAGIAGGGGELVEDGRVLGMGGELVARRYLRQQLAFRLKAHARPHA